MNLRLIYVGKTRTPYIQNACADFGKRLVPYFPLEEIEVRAADGSDPVFAMREEAERIANLKPGTRVVLLQAVASVVAGGTVWNNS